MALPKRRKRRGRALARRHGRAVRVVFGDRAIDGTLVEDRGNIGADGEHMVRVRLGEGDDSTEFDIAADAVKPRRKKPAA